MKKLFVHFEGKYHIDGVSFFSADTREEVVDMCFYGLSPKSREDYKSDESYNDYLKNTFPKHLERYDKEKGRFCEELIEIPVDKVLNGENGLIKKLSFDLT